MTTNQTIDGVPLLPCPFCGGEPYGTHDHYVHDDLSPMPCVECRACSAHLKAEDWNRRAEPASQPRGETVAWHCVGDIGTEHVTLSQDCADAWFSHGGRSLPLVYAEQSAPVGVFRDFGSPQTDPIGSNPHFEYADKQRSLRPHNTK